MIARIRTEQRTTKGNSSDWITEFFSLLAGGTVFTSWLSASAVMKNE
jgi:hypothetical protein